MTRIPDQVETWIQSTLGPWQLVADASWPRSTSRVWQVRLGVTSAFVKISPSAASFRRERSALADVLPGAVGVRTQALLAADEKLRTIVTARIDGDVVRTLDPPPPAVVERVIHARGGAAARAVHDQVEHLGDGHADRARSARTSHLLEVADRRLAGCRHVLSAEDFGWLFATTWDRRPDLRDAFFDGYGRSLTGPEWTFLAAGTVLGCLQHIDDGVRRGIDEKVARGMSGLRVSRRALARFAGA